MDVRNGIAAYRLLFDIFDNLRADAANSGTRFQLLFPPDERIFRHGGNDTELERFLRLGISITDHFACTTRMSNSSRRGVVDGQLRVHGTQVRVPSARTRSCWSSRTETTPGKDKGCGQLSSWQGQGLRPNKQGLGLLAK